MLNVTKRKAPACLDVLRATPGASWASVHGDQKQELRRAALAEQGGVCAYCNRRIVDLDRDEKPGCTIEHWSARGDGGDPFEWSDLIAVCWGNLDGVPHCDKSRGKKPLTLHPADPRCDVEALVTFTADGRARCLAHAADIDTLNLNHPTLVRSRREIVDVVRRQLEGADLTRLRAAEVAWARADLRPEYASVALPLIRRLLRLREGRSERTKAAR